MKGKLVETSLVCRVQGKISRFINGKCRYCEEDEWGY